MCADFQAGDMPGELLDPTQLSSGVLACVPVPVAGSHVPLTLPNCLGNADLPAVLGKTAHESAKEPLCRCGCCIRSYGYWSGVQTETDGMCQSCMADRRSHTFHV